MSTHRSIVITFGKDDPVVRSDIDFHRKLTDMRERYPTWSIRGITHERERLIPEKPRSTNVLQSSVPGEDGAYIAKATDDDALNAAECGSQDLHSDDSTGNVVGEPPREVKVGLLVRVMIPPYDGKRGTVVSVRDENRFQVLIGEGVSWWCSCDDVVVDRNRSEEEPAVSLSTLELMDELRRKNAQLELETARYRSAFAKLRKVVGDAVCDEALATT